MVKINFLVALTVAALAIFAAGASLYYKSGASLPANGSASLDTLDSLPSAFGVWRTVGELEPAVSPALPDAFGNPVKVYDKVVQRSYKSQDGIEITLLIAYKRSERIDDRVHSPELCYYGQGFALSNIQHAEIDAGFPIATTAFRGTSISRDEDVIYWIRTGNAVSESPLLSRLVVLRSALRLRSSDGVVVRASTYSRSRSESNSSTRIALLKQFMTDFLKSLRPDTRLLLVGDGSGK